MIDLLPYIGADLYRLWPFIHPVSQAELGEVTLPTFRDLLSKSVDEGHFTTGRRTHDSQVILAGIPDSRVMFIAGTIPMREGLRGTVFIFAKGFDTTIAFGLRRWAEREREIFPNTAFFVHSGGSHPLKHRFLKIAGCEHIEGDIFAVPALLQV